MKKTITVALYAVMILIIAGCGYSSAAPANRDLVRLSWGTVNSTGANYIIGSAIANTVNKHSEVPVLLTAEVSTGSTVNLRNMSEGNIEMGCVNSDLTLEYYNKQGDYTAFGNDRIRSLFSFYGSRMHIVVPANSDIHSFSDLRGKRVAFGAPGSGYQQVSTKFLNSQGLSYADFQAVETNPPQAVDAMRDGQLDGFMYSLQVPVSNITDMTLAMDIRLIALTKEEVKKFTDMYPGYSEYVIPGGSYAKNPDDIYTTGVRTVTVTDNSLMDEETAYSIMKAMWEYRDEWASAHFMTIEMNIEDNIQYLSAPLHIGAYKYYKEKGVNIPDRLVPPEAK